MRAQFRSVRTRKRNHIDYPEIPWAFQDLVSVTLVMPAKDAAQLKAGQLLHIKAEDEK